MNYSLTENTFDFEEAKSIITLIKSGDKLTYDKNVRKIEKIFAKLNKRKYCVMVNSGSSANLLGISSLIFDDQFDLSAGDEIIVPSLSWSTTYTPLIQYGIKLVFIDIEKLTLNIDVNLIEKAITKKTKGIFIANILGLSCDFHKLKHICKAYNLFLLEDNCESLLSKYKNILSGTNGLFSTCSSYFSHHFSTIEGGYLLTDNFRLYCNALSLRSHGWTREQPSKSHLLKKRYTYFEKSYKFLLPGYNLRPTEISAKLGIIQIQKIKKFMNARKQNAKKIYEIFKDLKSAYLQKYDPNSSFFGFAIILTKKLKKRRDIVINYMKRNKIETRPIVSGDITKNPMVRFAKYRIPFHLKNTKYIDRNGFMIGNKSKKLTINEIKTLNNFKKFLSKFN